MPTVERRGKNGEDRTRKEIKGVRRRGEEIRGQEMKNRDGDDEGESKRREGNEK